MRQKLIVILAVVIPLVISGAMIVNGQTYKELKAETNLQTISNSKNQPTDIIKGSTNNRSVENESESENNKEQGKIHSVIQLSDRTNISTVIFPIHSNIISSEPDFSNNSDSNGRSNSVNISTNLDIDLKIKYDKTSDKSTMVDKFDIKMIYPTLTGGGEWYMNSPDPVADSQFHPKTEMIKNEDGSWKISSKKVRLNVYPAPDISYDRDAITSYDQIELADKGFMQSPNDWKNVEMTGYVRVNSFEKDDNFAWYARGGKHNTEACEGTAYKGGLFYSGKTRFSKEQWFPGGYSFTDKKVASDPIQGKWIGFKFVMYNIIEKNEVVVKLENWIDKNNDGEWIKVDEKIDSGGWGEDGEFCGGKKDQIISWGGPVATFRWDSATDVDIKNLSVREIQVPK